MYLTKNIYCNSQNISIVDFFRVSTSKHLSNKQKKRFLPIVYYFYGYRNIVLRIKNRKKCGNLFKDCL